ncbi:mannan chain length control protein LmeA [Mycobacterium sp. NPDC003323]
MRQNDRVRRVLIGVVSTIVAVITGAVGTDFGAAIYAEYRLARSVRDANQLSFDPWVSILGFPFSTQARAHRYDELEIRAAGVAHPVTGRVSLEATLHQIDLTESSWLIGPDAVLPVGKAEGRIILDSTHVGRYIGMSDLLVEAPTSETEDGFTGVTESGISSGEDLVFTGTPDVAGVDERVSVAVDLTLADPGDTTLVLTPTGVLTGPGTAGVPVPDDKTAAVLDAFRGRIPGLRLPFALQPTAAGARGSDLIIEGIDDGLTLRLDEFRQS